MDADKGPRSRARTDTIANTGTIAGTGKSADKTVFFNPVQCCDHLDSSAQSK